MRTLTATMMALLMVLLAAGCGGEPEGGPESSSRPTEPAVIAAPTAALELPPTATPHPTIMPAPTPEPTPTAAPEPTPLPMVMRHGEEMLEAAARALDSGVHLTGQNQEPSFVRHNRHEKHRYSWAVDLDPLKPGR